MYKEIFDEKHTLVKSNVLDFDKLVQDGEKEGNLLCKKCDNELIGSFEKYASEVLYGGNIQTKQLYYKKSDESDEVEYTRVEGLDYRKFKLFLLSILWRASISSKDFFSSVSLGRYEEKLRQMIFTQNAGEEGDFPCVLISYRKRNFPKIIRSPIKKRTQDNKITYDFLISALSYRFKVSENDSSEYKKLAIKRNGELYVYHPSEDLAKERLEKMLGIIIPVGMKFN
jgi:hypothetical protein